MALSKTYTFAGAAAAVAGWGDWERIIFDNSGTWTAGSVWSVESSAPLIGDFVLGEGYLGAAPRPACGLVLSQRYYIGNGTQTNFSELEDPSLWNEQNPGAGTVPSSVLDGQTDTVQALANFQGRLAIFGRQNVQVWQINADPDLFQWQQTLNNIGTQYPHSAFGLGKLDVMFLDDSGIRSLRTLLTTLNATVYDVGTAVDVPIVLKVRGGIATDSVFGIVEPITKRAWMIFSDVIYVLSYFPEVKTEGWTTYLPTDSGGNTFVPTWPTVYNGRLYLRSATRLYSFGGYSTAPSYDTSVITLQSPWLDAKSPKMRKQSESFGVACSGAWSIYASMQPSAGTPTNLIGTTSTTASPSEAADSLYDLQVYPYSDGGTHIAFVATCATAGTLANPVKFSAFNWHYLDGESV